MYVIFSLFYLLYFNYDKSKNANLLILLITIILNHHNAPYLLLLNIAIIFSSQSKITRETRL